MTICGLCGWQSDHNNLKTCPRCGNELETRIIEDMKQGMRRVMGMI